MSKRLRFTPPLFLFAIIIIASIAATPAQLVAPGQPTAVATDNPGELQMSWNPVPGAQHYTVGYASPDEMDRMAAAGRNRLDAFYYATIGAENTSHTFTGLEPETVYWVTVGAHTPRFRATDLVWATRHAVATTAGEHGDGFCPITGLPIPAGGYLSVGDTATFEEYFVTLNSADMPETIVRTRSDGTEYDRTPPPGRKWLAVSTRLQNDFDFTVRVDGGHDHVMSTDAGNAFDWTGTRNLEPDYYYENTRIIFDIPEDAAVAVWAIRPLTSDYGDNAPQLFRILIPGDISASPTTTALTPLTNQELTKLVKPALGQIVTETGSGTGFVVRSNGLMVTNRHVVDDASTVTVYMQDLNGQLFEYTGTVLGQGILADLAVVQLPAGRTYSTLSLANSDAVSGADEVTAWGYPAGSISGTYPTITRGIISSKGIHGDVDFLQTDAAINPGNSGGPLIDQYGQVVGVNSMKTVHDAIDNQGFAIASNEVSNRLNTLVAGGLASETYRNTKYGYGYSVNIPKGWYLNSEGEYCTSFWTYDSVSSALLCAEDVSPVEGRAADLDWVADIVWDVWQSIAETDEWPLIELVSRQKLGATGQEYYRLDWRSQIYADYCVSDEVSIIALSSSYPNNTYGFELNAGVCEGSSNQHFTERAAILNSFRP